MTNKQKEALTIAGMQNRINELMREKEIHTGWIADLTCKLEDTKEELAAEVLERHIRQQADHYERQDAAHDQAASDARLETLQTKNTDLIALLESALTQGDFTPDMQTYLQNEIKEHKTP